MKLKLIVFSLLLPLVALGAKPIITENLEINPVNLPVEQQIEYFSKLYGGSADIITKVMYCESDGKQSAIGDGSRSRGIFQFQKATFERMEKIFGEDLNYDSQFDQIKLATWAISSGYGNEWTAYRAIMNGGRYSFYSSQLHKHFVVYCK